MSALDVCWFLRNDYCVHFYVYFLFSLSISLHIWILRHSSIPFCFRLADRCIYVLFLSGLPFYYYNFVTQFNSTDIHTLVFEVFALVSHRNFRRNIDFCKWKTFVSSTTPLCIFRSRSRSVLFFVRCFSIPVLPSFFLLIFFSYQICYIHHVLYADFIRLNRWLCRWNMSNKQTTTKNYIRNECNQSHTLSHSHTLGDKSDGGSWTKMHGNYFVDDKEL